MENADVLIIGAGATGLMTARELSNSGKKVIILEARDRIGGRIHTLNDAWHTELGAEFVHGDLPVTLQLLKEAGIEAIPASGAMWNYHDGKFSQEYQQIEHRDLLIKKLNQLQIDTAIGDFLEQEFGEDRYEGLRVWIHKYVAGYDTADPFKASCFALRKEWQNEEQGAQHRVKGGYAKMIGYLADESIKKGAGLILNAIVKNVYWQHNQVEAITTDNKSYKATKLIIALPLGILQSGAITVSPSIPQYQQAINQMGFGAIIKILLEFKEAFWEGEDAEKLTRSSLKEMSFLLSNEPIPTWWTQFPEHSPVLTGWLGGLPAEKQKDATDEELLHQALQSLSNLFKLSIEELKHILISNHIVNWTTDPFTLGSYAYDTVEATEARKLLSTPINYTVFFAGEYLYDGPAMGTVEAALTSGLNVAKILIS